MSPPAMPGSRRPDASDPAGSLPAAPSGPGRNWARSILTYLWASPVTLVASAIFLPLAWLGGGQARWVAGVLEIHGGGVKLFLSSLVPIRGGATAMTLGHVVIGRDRASLDRTRSHERVHVGQYERFGPFMLPAYVLLSMVMWLRGRHYYFDHPFEAEARRGAELADSGGGAGAAG